MAGLLRGVTWTAAAAGTARSVSSRVRRRQRGRWAEQDARRTQESAQYGITHKTPSRHASQPTATPAAGAPDMDATIAQLRELAALHDRGVLTDLELAAQKARILDS